MKKLVMLFLLFSSIETFSLDDGEGLGGDFELLESDAAAPVQSNDTKGDTKGDTKAEVRDIESGKVVPVKVDISSYQERSEFLKQMVKAFKLQLKESRVLKEEVHWDRRMQECVCVYFMVLCVVLWWKFYS